MFMFILISSIKLSCSICVHFWVFLFRFCCREFFLWGCFVVEYIYIYIYIPHKVFLFNWNVCNQHASISLTCKFEVGWMSIDLDIIQRYNAIWFPLQKIYMFILIVCFVFVAESFCYGDFLLWSMFIYIYKSYHYDFL